MRESTDFWTSNDSAPAFVAAREKDNGNIGVLRADGFSVPILWSMCFGAEDVNVQAPGSDKLAGVSCDAPRKNAIARLERRMPSLLTLLPAHVHDVAQQFLDRLRQSTESHVHLDLSVIQAEEDDAAEVEAWAREYWGALLDGLDVPVSKIRTGLASRLRGSGVPSGWEGLCRWSVGNAPLEAFLSLDLKSHHLAGAEPLN